MSTVLLEKKGHVALMTLNRPEVLNALDDQMRIDLIATLDEIERDDDIYVVVLTGAGRAFLAGADIAEMRDRGTYISSISSEESSYIAMRIQNLKKPIIAAVNGFALGGGLEIALACDIRIASEKGRFGLPEAGLGIMTGLGGAVRLPRAVGFAKALEMASTAKIMKAAEAKELGIVSYVYPPEEFLDKALEMAQQIAANAQIAVQQCKMAIRASEDTDIENGCKLEVEANAVCFATEDKYEGMGAFLEKRAEKNFQYK